MDSAVNDLIDGENATSLSPQFSTDRNGAINGSIWVNSNQSAWQFPSGTYFKGDFTITLWVKKVVCGDSNYGYNPYSK
jgi:hypothetical protein